MNAESSITMNQAICVMGGWVQCKLSHYNKFVPTYKDLTYISAYLLEGFEELLNFLAYSNRVEKTVECTQYTGLFTCMVFIQ